MKTRSIIVITLGAALIALASGCVHTEVQLPNGGGRFSRTSFLSTQTVGNVTVKMEGADKGVKIDQYGQNGVDVAKAALTLLQAAAAPVKP